MILARVTYHFQRLILRLSYRWHRSRRNGSSEVSWVIGPVEIASMVANLAKAIPGSYSVSLAPSRFYAFEYDYSIPPRRDSWRRRVVGAPWLLGRLARSARGILYVGAEGFLLDGIDDRKWEFEFLRRHGLRVVCLFTGNDIRSPALMRDFEVRTGFETIATYLDQVSPVFGTAAYDDVRRRRARVADSYANAIFNASVDQMSYLERRTEPFPYFIPDADVLMDDSKHAMVGPLVVLHAPSSPIIKGTQVVRAAVRRLQSEGYTFEYRELIDVPHSQVLAQLREAHIVLNEFYAFMPGVFGVEAMAANCALLTRADETIETDLPPGSNGAWIVTSAADIYIRLRSLLEKPDLVAFQADAGRRWVLANATASASGGRVSAVLDTL